MSRKSLLTASLAGLLFVTACEDSEKNQIKEIEKQEQISNTENHLEKKLNETKEKNDQKNETSNDSVDKDSDKLQASKTSIEKNEQEITVSEATSPENNIEEENATVKKESISEELPTIPNSKSHSETSED